LGHGGTDEVRCCFGIGLGMVVLEGDAEVLGYGAEPMVWQLGPNPAC
jgi:hypothetical protein